ncbi:unnamed protein product [Linum trigynum]|uniref:DUF4283 domain-containing protein n=1 Tax=Linum trigynum TaxID=586398 RepID=A0AAV2F6B4_9ROSI
MASSGTCAGAASISFSYSFLMSVESAVVSPPATETSNGDVRGIPTKPWASLFSISEANRLTYIPQEVVNGGLRMPKAVREAGAARWKNCLVGQFLQDPSSLYVLRRWVNKLWGRDGLVRVSLLYDKMLLIQLPNQQVCEWILENGPWFWFNNLLYLRPWVPGISVEDLGRKALPIWVHLANVPLEYNDFQGLSRIASWEGVPLGVDHTTRVGNRHEFAKVLVELTAESEFPDHVLLWPDDDSSIRIGVSYCNLPPVCLVCKLFGVSGACVAHHGKQWVPVTQKTQEVLSSPVQAAAEEEVQNVPVATLTTSGKGKEVQESVDPQLQAIFTSPSLVDASRIIPQNLEKSFSAVAGSSSPKLPTDDEFQRVLNGAKPRVWSNDKAKGAIQASTSSFIVLSHLGDKESGRIMDAPKKKDVRRDQWKGGGGKPPTSK